MSLVCTTLHGVCFSPVPDKPRAACSCAGATGVVDGVIADTLSPGVEVNLSSVVLVHYATDRKMEGTSAKPEFGSEKGPVSYGVARVSIPATHQTGNLEAPSQLVRIKFLENSKKHVLVLAVTPAGKEQFFRQLEARVRNSARSEAFIFVHGFNVSFDDALRRTGQMAFDLGFEGAPVLYSWPSRASPSPLAYTADAETVKWSKQLLRDFLGDFMAKTTASNVYLIAHSMGNRPLTESVLSLFSEQPQFRSRIKEVILAAPDINADVFKRDVVPGLVGAGRPITIYASSQDKALRISKIINSAPRAGDSGPGLVVVDGVETIDASAVDTSFLGHSYFADTREVMSDIQSMFGQGLRAKQRPGLRQMTTVRPYWEFRK